MKHLFGNVYLYKGFALAFKVKSTARAWVYNIIAVAVIITAIVYLVK